jgi:pimeloyl-ACP methyl ester carboxylesterase
MTRLVELTHNRVRLALHHLREGTGRPLLVLHGLGERSPAVVPAWASTWDGPVAALDFTGHGSSTIPRGGGYTSEMLLADADIALAELGTATVVGRGLGAYIALQLAGARPREVVGAVLCDGPGLAGGPAEPTSQSYVSVQGSELDEPITVAAIYRPAWLEAVAAEHGVASATLPAALAAYAGVR